MTQHDSLELCFAISSPVRSPTSGFSPLSLFMVAVRRCRYKTVLCGVEMCQGIPGGAKQRLVGDGRRNEKTMEKKAVKSNKIGNLRWTLQVP